MSDTPFGQTPHDDRAEQVVLGCLLTSKGAYVEVADVLKGHDFYAPRHETLYDKLIDLAYEDKPTDPVSVHAALSPQDSKRIGGIDYLYELARAVPVSATAGSFAKTIRDLAVRRRLQTVGLRIAEDAVRDTSVDVNSTLADAQHAFDEAVHDSETGGLLSIGDTFEPTIDAIEELQRNGNDTGVPTGFADLDRLTTGFQPGQMVIVAARPAVGKALHVNTLLPTPGEDPITMGQARPGDVILGSSGQPVTITGTSTIRTDRDCFQVEFSDQSTIVADADHEWTIHRPDHGRYVTVTTTELAALVSSAQPVSVHGGVAPGQVRGVVSVTPARSVPVKCLTVDETAAPDRLFLAGPTGVPTHNSTLALDFARAAAIHNAIPTVVFSLEMDAAELTKRLIAAEARVPLQNLRSGEVEESQWQQIGRHAGRIMEAPLFIDDTPGITPHEIRAKAQQVKARHGLGLVIVDYLQLMSSGRRVESRQQEVSEFSRSMKLTAKSLRTPVVALSQLNRGPEQRADKKPQMSDLRESGCLSADTELDSPNGPVTFAHLMEHGWEGVEVWSVDEDTGDVVLAPVTNVFASGTKPTFVLVLDTGEQVEATGNHKFLTRTGWTRLDELTAGQDLHRRDPLTGALTTGTIQEIRPTGRAIPVFDATVAGTHNFIANGIVAHNSLEQDADVVILLHREDAHDPETPRAGEADVIIAKQRNGPTGVVPLAAQLMYSRFFSMAAGHGNDG